MQGSTVELSHEEYRTAWHTLGLGTRHCNIDLPGLPELTEEQRQIQLSRTLEGMRARGLADQRGVVPMLEDALRVLACPTREINGWVQTGGVQVRLLAGSRGELGVLAVLDAHRLVVRTGAASGLCLAVARLLPDRPAGPGSSVSVLSDLLARPAREGQRGLTGQQLENRLTQGGTKPADAHSFAVMIHGPKPGGGKFGVARFDRTGRRHVARAPLAYLATEHGGYTLQTLRGLDGVSWTTLAPATLAQLAQRVGQLIDGVRTG